MLIFEYACNSSQTFLLPKKNFFGPLNKDYFVNFFCKIYEQLLYNLPVQNIIFKNDNSSILFVLFLIKTHAFLSGLFLCSCPKVKFMLMFEYAYVSSQPLPELQNAYVRICFYSNKYGTLKFQPIKEE